MDAPGFNRDALADTQINPNTLLATDYLNHFNEAVMLIDMLPSMPECIAELEEWEEVSYAQHFEQSGLRYSALAIEAYNHAPAHLRALFDASVSILNDAVKAAIQSCREVVDTRDMQAIEIGCSEAAQQITPLVERVGAIINGHVDSTPEEDHAQDAIDALFGD